MADKKVTGAIIDALKHNGRMIDVLLAAVADHAVAMVESMPRCQVEGCMNVATVCHARDNRRLCDRCCAEAIYRARQLQKLLNNISGKDADERTWIDLPAAVEVRAIIKHYDLLTELDATVH